LDIYLGCQIGTKNINFVGDNKMNITTELGLNWLGGYGEYGNAKAYGQSEDHNVVLEQILYDLLFAKYNKIKMRPTHKI
jgi:hypothetical protein